MSEFDKMRPDDLVSDWNLHQYIGEDIADVHRTITDKRSQFAMLKGSNRGIYYDDLVNINQMLSLVEQIADMTFIYIVKTDRERFYQNHDKIVTQLNKYFKHLETKKTSMPNSFIEEISQHMKVFYMNCARSNLWLKSSRRGYAPKSQFFTD